MRQFVASSGLAVLAIATAGGCTTLPAPTAPSTSAVSTAPSPPAPPPVPVPDPGPFGGTFPAIVAPARIFNATSAPFYEYHGGRLWSRYVLYHDKSFSLQYSSLNFPFFEYRGTYSEVDGNVTFSWEGWSTAGPWGATGTLAGDIAYWF